MIEGPDDAQDMAQKEVKRDISGTQEAMSGGAGSLRETGEVSSVTLSRTPVQSDNLVSAGLQVDSPGEIHHCRGNGRRVNLRRDSNGAYSIWMGNSRLVQSFCSGEWEDITRFQLPEGIQQQCRINVESLGEAREWDQREFRGRDDVAVAGGPQVGRFLMNIAHPRPVNNDLIGMFNELSLFDQEVIEKQIREGYESLPDQSSESEEPPLTVTVEMFNDLRRQLVDLSDLIHNSR